ncbi:hypothetical protein Nmel_013232, partial [Mimus melanotis]
LCVVLAVQDRLSQGSLGCLSVLTSLINSAPHAHGWHPASAHPGGHAALCGQWHRGSVFCGSCRAQPHPELAVAHPEQCLASTKDGLSLVRLQRDVWSVQSWAQASLLALLGSLHGGCVSWCDGSIRSMAVVKGEMERSAWDLRICLECRQSQL